VPVSIKAVAARLSPPRRREGSPFDRLVSLQVVGSITDASLKDVNAAPWTKDVLITAEKRVNGAHTACRRGKQTRD